MINPLNNNNNNNEIRPKQIKLCAGPLELIFDNGMIRSVIVGSFEIVRRVYVALRDENWNTIPYTLNDLLLEKDDASFELSFTAHHSAGEIDFKWNALFEGRKDGSLSLSFDGKALSTFKRNRIGWCVLHPLDLCRGASCTIVKTDGTVVNASFPKDEIAPWQPFTEMRSLSMCFDEEATYTLRFSEDEFETEDQRNWTDASFKTYSTRASLPIPVIVEKGTRIRQKVEVALSGVEKRSVYPKKSVVMIDSSLSEGKVCRLSEVGVFCSNDVDFSRLNINSIKALSLSHCTITITRFDRQLPALLERWEHNCRYAGCAAEVQLFVSNAQWRLQVEKFLNAATESGIPLRRIICLSKEEAVTPSNIADGIGELLSRKMPGVRCIAGGKRYFVDVNRSRPEYGNVNGVCFAATPQVHTFDDRAILENGEGIAECVTALKNLYPHRSVHIVPLTLRPRKVPGQPKKFGGPDPRQKTRFAAVWLFGSLCYGAQTGLTSLTVENLAGHDGLMGDDGELYPVYHLLSSGILKGSGERVVIVRNGEEFIAGLRFSLVGKEVLLIANMSCKGANVHVRTLPNTATITNLDSTSEDAARGDCHFWETHRDALTVNASGCAEVTLEPYALARIRFQQKFSRWS